MLKIDTFLAFELSDVVFIMLINVKIPTIVGILTFMCMTNFMLSCGEHDKCVTYKISEPVIYSSLIW